ncbi:hypothetical protein C1752_00958 [Acaryochloris thomasi RCC1774]|uniref:Secreted protein n=1 Tax=Acaryochloris thomasi RCC1774 TaxID=1764569 RepID=A0A2W1JNX4_9CYAN|nr:hypothetical protein C1752_00958 [Acaryochloris thomasi RCC1774]
MIKKKSRLARSTVNFASLVLTMAATAPSKFLRMSIYTPPYSNQKTELATKFLPSGMPGCKLYEALFLLTGRNFERALAFN